MAAAAVVAVAAAEAAFPAFSFLASASVEEVFWECARFSPDHYGEKVRLIEATEDSTTRMDSMHYALLCYTLLALLMPGHPTYSLTYYAAGSVLCTYNLIHTHCRQNRVIPLKVWILGFLKSKAIFNFATHWNDTIRIDSMHYAMLCYMLLTLPACARAHLRTTSMAACFAPTV